MKISAAFVTSAAGPSDFPGDGLPEIALVGRSNVGKSSLINALVRQRLARTSAAPGKTRLANLYRVARGSAAPFYLVDLPGFGYARGAGVSPRGEAAGRRGSDEFEELTAAYFGRAASQRRGGPDEAALSALLLVDSRHPGLDRDREAWRWLTAAVERAAIVATKIDKLARGERIRAMRQLESVFEQPVLPVSAVTGEGLEELWKLIDRLNRSRNPRSSHPPPKATAPPPRNESSGSTSRR